MPNSKLFLLPSVQDMLIISFVDLLLILSIMRFLFALITLNEFVLFSYNLVIRSHLLIVLGLLFFNLSCTLMKGIS